MDVLKRISAVLTWLLAIRWWIILCRNVQISSDFMKQTLFGLPWFSNAHIHPSPSLSSLLICLLYQYNFVWSKGAYFIHILILLKVLGVLTWLKMFSEPLFKSKMWICNYYFYTVIKINLHLMIFLSWQNQLCHVHCVSWNTQKS